MSSAVFPVRKVRLLNLFIVDHFTKFLCCPVDFGQRAVLSPAKYSRNDKSFLQVFEILLDCPRPYRVWVWLWQVVFGEIDDCFVRKQKASNALCFIAQQLPLAAHLSLIALLF